MHTAKPESPDISSDLSPPESLLKMNKDKKDIIVRGKDIIDKYIERNTSYEIQTAIALKFFSVSVRDGDGVITVCNLAAKLSGFSSEVVRRWTWTIYVEYFGRLGNFDDVDDIELVAELTSNRGKHVTLFEDDQFLFDAREYIRSASYSKVALSSCSRGG